MRSRTNTRRARGRCCRGDGGAGVARREQRAGPARAQQRTGPHFGETASDTDLLRTKSMVFIPGLLCPPVAGGSARTELPQSNWCCLYSGRVAQIFPQKFSYLRLIGCGCEGMQVDMASPVDDPQLLGWRRCRENTLSFDQPSMAVSRSRDNQYRAVQGARLFDRMQLRGCDTEAQGQLLNQQRREVGAIIA